jgi:hypothetical protein
MPRSHLLTRVRRLEKSTPRQCPACHGALGEDGRPLPRDHMGVLFLYEGVLYGPGNEPVPEERQVPCPTCGGGGVAGHKVIAGVSPWALMGIERPCA